MLKLISATPSPYARKVRIALAEKGIPFELVTEVPWNSTTATPQYNPLEKLPVLIFEDGSSVYESRYILEVIEAKWPEPPLVPADTWERLAARKVDGGLRELARIAGGREWMVGDSFGLADIATGTVLRYLDVRFPEHPWRSQYPNLVALSARLEARPSFAATVPVPQVISDKVV